MGFLAVPDGPYFLSSNGSDSNDCRSSSTPCRSLRCVLSLFYNQTELIDAGIEIKTSESLYINDGVLVRF